MESDICPICVKPIIHENSSSRLTEKGISSLLEANKERQDQPINFVLNSRIHKDCRINYCHKREIKKYLSKKENNISQSFEINKSSLRSSTQAFSFKTDCFFCCQELCRSKDEEIHCVETLSLKESLLRPVSMQILPGVHKNASEQNKENI